MKSDSAIHLLFTVDNNYARHISVVLKSLRVNDPGWHYHVHLICNNMDNGLEDGLSHCCTSLGYGFSTYRIEDALLQQAPVNKHYSLAMYYRLFAPKVLPASISKVIYLDPDILIINPLHPLWDMDMEGATFLAASHTEDQKTIESINRLRLNTDSPYYNTGVMVMDLEKARRVINRTEIYDFIEMNAHKLLLPDQDVFNALYGDQTKLIPDEIWNYDARKYPQYLIRSGGQTNEAWIIKNTVILHYCGKSKPWDANYRFRFGNLYLHYSHLACSL